MATQTDNKIEGWIKELEVRKAAVAAERDKLRDFIGEAEELAENCDTAADDIQSAIDKLSELV